MYAKLLLMVTTSGLIICAALPLNELWIQPVQDVSVAENSSVLDDSIKTKWLSENAMPIHSIDPNDDDFADLMPLKHILGSARIVMLGEATHGDGATFYAKQRLVRFLHEVMGFNVLAWEAHFFRIRLQRWKSLWLLDLRKQSA